MRDTVLLPNWSVTKRELEDEFLTAQHGILDTGLFDDENLIRILDTYPSEDLGVSAMGRDAERPDEWRSGTAGAMRGDELLDAVRRGRLWLNLRRIASNDRDMGHLVEQLYAEMNSKTPGLKTFDHSANLLISSPSAIVYYHMDCPVNMLWHLRGEKLVYAYPRTERFLPMRVAENVVAGTSSEEIHYESSFDDDAFVTPLLPGQLISWPQHSPHRVVNTDGLNVSLSTEHYTKEALRRNNVMLANRHFRSWSAALGQNADTRGIVPAFKELAIRVCRRIPGLAPAPPKGFEYPKTFRIDLDAPNCIANIDSGCSQSSTLGERQPVLD